MAFKRDQALKAAEKLVSRGKIEAAIKEYRKVLKKVPDDINTLNRVGDLYARIHRNDEAINLYSQIASKYGADGFYVKAIAVYKKIHRLDPTRLEVYEKLAELYHRQGLINDARSQYQVLADYYLKHRDAASAISIYQKMVDLEPENPSHHAKLAELYQQQKLLARAVAEYAVIAELMLSHGHLDEALQVYQRALDVDASDHAFLAKAVLALKKAGHAHAGDKLLAVARRRNPGAAEAAQRALKDASDAETLVPGRATAADAAAAAAPAAPEQRVEPQVPTKPVQEAPAPAQPTPPAADTGPREVPGAPVDAAPPAAADEPPAAAREQFAEGYEEFVLDLEDEEAPASLVKPPSDMLEEAAAAQAEVGPEIEIELEADEPVEVDWDFQPEPQLPAQTPPAEESKIEFELEADAGAEARPPEAAPPTTPIPPPEAAQPPWEAMPPTLEESGVHIDQALLERTAAEVQPKAVHREDDLLAEAEVFVKYGLQEKAVDRLREVLEINPKHLGAYSQLIALFLEQGSHERVMDLANEMVRVTQETGSAETWREIRLILSEAGFQVGDDRVVGIPGAAAAAEAVEPAQAVPMEPEEPLEVAPPEPGVEPAAAAAPAGTGDVAFELVPDEVPSELSIEIEEPVEPAAAAAPSEVAESAPTPPEQPVEPQVPTEPVIAASPPVQEPPSIAEHVLGQPQTAPEIPAAAAQESGAGALAGVSPPPEEAAAPAASARESAPAGSGINWLDEMGSIQEAQAGGESLFEDEEEFFDLAAELEEELRKDAHFREALMNQPQEQSLDEIVEGFKKGVAENLSPEDTDTHYNLGIAYREMGLLDEAIGEFQIAAKDEKLLVDCCSMLGICFREKGLPELAIKWYKKALGSPNITEEATLGMLYDLGNLYMDLNDLEAAYAIFVEVYGINTNYRDVVAKLQELKPGQ